MHRIMSSITVTFLVAFIVVILGALGGDRFAQGGEPPMKAIYGFSLKHQCRLTHRTSQ
jgi:hypothetical protein